MKQWGVSSVLRACSDDGDVFFKATNPAMELFVNEAAITSRLAAMFPECITAPLAVGLARDWMLLPAFDELLADRAEQVRIDLYPRFAQLQVEAASRHEELFDAGCLDRRAPVMRDQVDPLLDDPVALARLDDDEPRQLHALRDRLKSLCEEFADTGVPDTLVHGDLHPGNGARMDGRIVYFDWTDACVAHPFIDLHRLMWIDEPARTTILQAYLEPWSALCRADRLDHAFRLARALLPLHHAVSYQYIGRGLEPDSKGELDATHTYLRSLLQTVSTLDAER